jgi:hypothetical protein
MNKTERKSQASGLPFNRRNNNNFKYLHTGLVSLTERQRKGCEHIKLVNEAKRLRRRSCSTHGKTE